MQTKTIETALLSYMRSKLGTRQIPLDEVAKEYFGYQATRTIEAKLKSGEFRKVGLVVKYQHDNKPYVDINDLVEFLTKPRKVSII